jgi:hypothetical protein
VLERNEASSSRTHSYSVDGMVKESGEDKGRSVVSSPSRGVERYVLEAGCDVEITAYPAIVLTCAAYLYGVSILE